MNSNQFEFTNEIYFQKPTNGNYSPDFDELSGDEKPTTHDSPSSEPKKNLTQIYSSDNHDDSDYPSKSTLKKTISTGSSENLYDQESSELFNSKKQSQTANTSNTIDNDQPTYARRKSSDSSEDFLGIKSSSTHQRKKSPDFEDDFFQSENTTNQPKTPAWRDDTFFDTK